MKRSRWALRIGVSATVLWCVAAGVHWAWDTHTIEVPDGMPWFKTVLTVANIVGVVGALSLIAWTGWYWRALERRAEESDRKHRGVLDSTQDVVFVVDRQDRLILANATLARCMARDLTQIIGRPRAELFPPEVAVRHSDVIARVFAGERCVETEGEVRCGDGHSRWMQTRFMPILNDDGTIQAVLGACRDQTEHRRTETSLIERERTYRAMFDHAMVGMFRIRVDDDRVEECNRCLAKILGCTDAADARDLLGGWACISDEGQRREIVRRLDCDGQIDQFETQLIGRTGERRWVRLSVAMRSGILEGVVVDITDRRRIEERLWLKEYAIESSLSAMAITDLSGDILYVNTALLQMWGYDVDSEVVRQPIEILWQGHDQTLNLSERLQESGEHVGEISGCRVDGTIFDAHLSASIVMDEDDQPVYWVASFIDISTIKQAQRALQESESRYRELAEALPDTVFETDLTGKITYANQTGKTMFGYTDEDVARGVGIFDVVSPDSIELIRQRMVVLNKGGISPGGEYTGVRRDGTQFPVMIHTSGMRRDGHIVGYRGVAVDISDRRRAEQARIESEGRYRTLVETSPDAISVTDFDGNIVISNHQAAVLHGYSSVAEMLAHRPTTFDFLRPEDREKGRQFREALIARGRVQNVRFDLYRKDGSTFPVEVSSSAIPGSEGQPMWFVGVIRDISERVYAERQMQNRLKMEARIAAISMRMIGVPPDGLDAAIGEAVAAIGELAGADRCHLYERFGDPPHIRCVHGWNAPGVESWVERLADVDIKAMPWFGERAPLRKAGFFTDINQIGEPSSPERELLEQMGVRSGMAVPIIQNGQTIALLAFALVRQPRTWTDDDTVLLTLAGEIISGAYIRRQAYNELLVSQRRYRDLVENMSEIVASSDAEGRFTYISPVIHRLLGYDPNELLGRGFREFIHPDDHSTVDAAIHRLLETGVSRGAEYRIRTAWGDYRWFHSTAQPIRGQDGSFMGISGMLSDIHRRKEAEDQLRRQNEILEQTVRERTKRVRELERQRSEIEKLAATGRMAARIAHEINNPLAGIKNSFLLIKDAVPADHPQYDYVGRIDREIARIGRIVRQMYDVYRPHCAERQPFSVEQMLNDVTAMLDGRCRERQLSLLVDASRAKESVVLPEDLVRQVMYNLIINAVDASPIGASVSVSATVDSSRLELTVTDRGCGMSDDVKERIFEPFFTTKGERGQGSLGLGLSVCKSLVEAMGGALRFESVEGQGTVFVVSIPRDNPVEASDD